MTDEELLAAAREQAANLTEELERTKESLKFCKEWWASRFRRLEDWARLELHEPLRTEFFSIVANGFKHWTEHAPAYERQLNMKEHEIERLKKECDKLQARINGEIALLDAQLQTTDELRKQLSAALFNKPYDCYWSRRAIAAERKLEAALKTTTPATIEHVEHCPR